MYRELSRHYSLIITVASPVQSSIEAQILARYADAVIMVARSRRVRGATLRRVLSKIQEAGTPVVGGILTGVSRLYMTKE
jgi:Mrp family chromosome partitioning ATPase